MESTHRREGSLPPETFRSPENQIGDQIQARTSGMAHGGSAVARVEGKAFFVDGALPGELISGHIERDKGSWGTIRLDVVAEPSPDRTEARCGHFGVCGGCQWQHGAYSAQTDWKRDIVAGQLEHLGRHPDPPVSDTVVPGPAYGYRNRMDYRVTRGRPALHERRSRRLVPLAECPILHPSLAALMTDLGDLTGATAITLRVATTTGDVLAVVTGTLPAQASAWGCNVAVIEDEALRAVHGDPFLFETVAGVPFRITGTSFFQNNTPGAEALVELTAASADVGPEDTLLDAYAGGGLFAATVGRSAGRVVAVEVDPVATSDLQSNLNRAGIEDFRIIRSTTEDAIEQIDEYWDVAIADPPRGGLGDDGVAAVIAADPRTLVYVSCDPASLARDSALLAATGYRLELVTPVDLFPQTFHIECVSRFVRDW